MKKYAISMFVKFYFRITYVNTIRPPVLQIVFSSFINFQKLVTHKYTQYIYMYILKS